MGPMVYFPTLIVDLYGIFLGKYTKRPMDPSWVVEKPHFFCEGSWKL